MLRFDANLAMMYRGLPLVDAMRAARADGFSAIEFQPPYSEPKERLADVAAELQVEVVQFNCPMGDFDAGERGIACLLGREAEFRASIDVAIEYASALGCRQVNCPVGIIPSHLAVSDLERVLVGNLRLAARRFFDAGVKLQIEPLNTRDNPGALLSTTGSFERIFEQVGDDNLYLQYDFYHMQIMQGDLMRTFERLRDRISHVQIADNPGRHEPGTGEINYSFIFSELSRLSYAGWIGCEYVPAAEVSKGLGWLHHSVRKDESS